MTRVELFVSMASIPPQKALFIGTEEELNELENAFEKEHRSGQIVSSLNGLGDGSSIVLWKSSAKNFMEELDQFNGLNDMGLTFLALSKTEFQQLDHTLQGELLTSLNPVYNE